MPKPTKGPRLGGSPAHERIILNNLASQLFQHGRITTTETKAKRVQPLAEKLITKAKRGDLHARRQAAASLKQDQYVERLFAILGPRYKERQGGYVRVLKAGFRFGDMAPMAIIEFVDRDTSAKGAADHARTAAEDAAEA